MLFSDDLSVGCLIQHVATSNPEIAVCPVCKSTSSDDIEENAWIAVSVAPLENVMTPRKLDRNQ
jgi:hypothetical protein